MLRELDFLSDSNDEEIKLKSIILSDNPADLSKPIKTNCEVQKAAYIFFQIQSLFHNLSFKNIETSKSFLTKQNRPFTANTISASKSKFLANIENTEDIIQIEEAIEKFRISKS